jgi:hypothetical protein
MGMRFDFIEGRFHGLDERGQSWRRRAKELGEQYADAFAFCRTRWAQNTVYANYFATFEEPPYDEAARFAKSGKVDRSIREFKWSAIAAPHVDLEPSAPGFDDSAWKTTDVAIDSWSSLGLHDWFHSVWYRAKFAGNRVRDRGGHSAHAFVWLGGGDGTFRVFVNGHEAPYVARPGRPTKPEGAGWFTFDVTPLLVDGENTLAVLAARPTLNELGIGGLTGPVVVYTE